MRRPGIIPRNGGETLRMDGPEWVWADLIFAFRHVPASCQSAARCGESAASMQFIEGLLKDSRQSNRKAEKLLESGLEECLGLKSTVES